ncbi:RagB/SusD family nutrient uptake outer membrane protein [Gemmatimonas sp.]|uniref:RagB/SusD family nutrient uptake outer membrane protein n=1 Tax=Gemmatimonas sp. TaxID=1962908 RepID=UPI00398321EE
MHSTLHSRARALAMTILAAGALASTGCNPTDFLTIEDPDIINPANVSSAAGANAARVGALARLNVATAGGESLLLLGGLFSDEWNNGDSFIARQEIDQRVITPQNNFLTDANRALHRARLSAEQSIELLKQFSPTAPGWQLGEMYFVQAYVEDLAAEHYCSGVVFSTVVDGTESYGTPLTTTATFTRALAHADSGLALVTGTTVDDVRVRSALQVIKGRILLGLNRPADAATAVTGVATTFQYLTYHALTTTSNQFWNFNNLAGRYSVSTSEGGNGINYALANDPRVPVCVGGDVNCRAIGVTKTSRDDLGTPYYVQRLWPARETSVAIVSGQEARLIEAEAQLRAGNTAGSLTTLNTLRATFAGMTPLADAGTEATRVDQLFRERAFTLFGRGTRTGDMRRLIRQYARTAATVFPTGAWPKGGNYGTDVTLPLPLAETNNPNAGAGVCIDRNP